MASAVQKIKPGPSGDIPLDKLLLRQADVRSVKAGVSRLMRDRLCAKLFSEIISWKLRMFVPSASSGVSDLSNVLERYPTERIGKREVA
jgi:hypothetical protein